MSLSSPSMFVPFACISALRWLSSMMVLISLTYDETHGLTPIWTMHRSAMTAGAAGGVAPPQAEPSLNRVANKCRSAQVPQKYHELSFLYHARAGESFLLH